MKKIAVPILFGFLIFASCKKVDLFSYELPTGRINGVIKSEVTKQPLKDIYILSQNTTSSAWHMVNTNPDGTFTIGRLASGKYSILPTNDSLYCPNEIFVDVVDGEVANVPEILLRPATKPVLTLALPASLVEVTNKAIKLTCWVDDGHFAVTSRGFKYIKSTDTRDVKVSGTSKAISTSADPWDLKSFTTSLTTGITSKTTYRIVAYVVIRNGTTSNGARKSETVYSTNEILVTTLL